MQLEIHDIGSRILEHYFTDEDIGYLSTVYSYLYPSNHLYIQRKHIYFYDLHVQGEHYLSNKARSLCSCVIMAIFHGNVNVDPEHKICRYGEIQCFIQHCIDLPNKEQNTSDNRIVHLFARVKWYCQHPRENSMLWPLWQQIMNQKDHQHSFQSVESYAGVPLHTIKQ